MAEPTADDAETDTQPPTAQGAPGMPYPGWLDQQLLTPSAPLAPGAAMRVTPVPITPFPHPEATPARWAPDPTGRHQWRWWGGVAWTDHVADDGVADEDPLEPLG